MYRSFRPRATVIVAITVSILLVVWELFLLWVIFLREGDLPFNAGLWALVVFIGIILIYRHGTVRADVSKDGIFIRNLVRSRQLEWPQIISVRLGEHPWVQLDLSDGTTIAVMAIQRADGQRGRDEAKRLATLVHQHGTALDPRD